MNINLNPKLNETIGQKMPDLDNIEFHEGRKQMAFDFCFKTIYPEVTEERMRYCVQ